MAAGHIGHHFESSDTVRDIVLGMDGLTVPFAPAAGVAFPIARLIT